MSKKNRQKSRRVATFAEEGKWTSGADATMLVGDWQAWVDGEGHWKVRGPDPDNEAHYADGDIELTEAEYIEAGNSEARRKIRARRAKEAARAYVKTMTQPSKRHQGTIVGYFVYANEILEGQTKTFSGALRMAKKIERIRDLRGVPMRPRIAAIIVDGNRSWNETL